MGFNLVFIKNDEIFNQQKESFIKKTLSHHNKKNNQRGSISLVAASFCMVMSFFLLFLTVKYTYEFHETKYRKEAYLCFFYLNEETKNYINEMSHYNKLLLAESIAMMIPATSAQAKTAHEITLKIRDARHFYYHKKILFNDYCEDIKLKNDYLKNWPFLVTKKRTLVTTPDGASIPRETQWTNKYFRMPSKKIRLKKAFALQADFSMQNAYFPDLVIETQEILN